MAGDGAFSDARALETGGFQGRAHLVDRTQTHCLVAHDAVVGFVVLAFELGLDQPMKMVPACAKRANVGARPPGR